MTAERSRIKKVKKKRRSWLRLIDFKLCLFAAYNLAYVLYMAGYMGRNVNLALLCLFVLYNGFELWGKTGGVLKSTDMIFWHEFKAMGASIVTFAAISILIQIFNFDVRLSYISSYLYLVLPLFAVFFWANTTSPAKRTVYIYVMFGRFILNFLLTNMGELSLDAIRQISFSDSMSSVFESSDAHSFFILMIVFLSMNKKLLAWISGIFCMLCFKRLSFILTPAILLLHRFIPNRRTNKTALRLCKVLFILLPVLLPILAHNVDAVSRLIGINIDEFTTGRFSLINYVENNMARYNGYGSISDFMINNPWGDYIAVSHMHCDLLQFYLETTVVGLAVYVNSLFNLGKSSYSRFIIVTYIAVEMITSHFVDVLAAWILFYMFCAIQDGKLKREKAKAAA